MTRSKKNKKEGKSKNKQRQNRKTGPASSGMVSAPAAVSDLKLQYTRFERAGPGGSSLIMSACTAIAEIGIAGLGAAGTVPGFTFSNGGVKDAAQLALTQVISSNAGAATTDGLVSPAWDLIASAFTRYRVKRLVFHYRPQATTTQTGRLVFAFAADPDHPLIWSALPNQTKLLACADSVPFAPWNAWSMDVTKRINQDMLMYTFDTSGSGSDGTDRLQSFGSVGCCADAPITNGVRFGVLYMEATVEFVEFCPVTFSSRPSFALVESRGREKPRMDSRNGRYEGFAAAHVDSGCKAEPQRPSPQSEPSNPLSVEESKRALKSLARDSWKTERLCADLLSDMREVLRNLSPLEPFEESPAEKQDRTRVERAVQVLEGIVDLGAECRGFNQC